MGKKLTYSFTGNCPHTKTRQTIYINYLEIPSIDTMATSWKKDGFRCAVNDDCPPSPHGDHRNCPLYLAAPTNPG